MAFLSKHKSRFVFLIVMDISGGYNKHMDIQGFITNTYFMFADYFILNCMRDKSVRRRAKKQIILFHYIFHISNYPSELGWKVIWWYQKNCFRIAFVHRILFDIRKSSNRLHRFRLFPVDIFLHTRKKIDILLWKLVKSDKIKYNQ